MDEKFQSTQLDRRRYHQQIGRFNARWNRTVANINSWLKWQKKNTNNLITNYGKKWNGKEKEWKRENCHPSSIVFQNNRSSYRKDCTSAVITISAAAISNIHYPLSQQRHQQPPTTTKQQYNNYSSLPNGRYAKNVNKMGRSRDASLKTALLMQSRQC